MFRPLRLGVLLVSRTSYKLELAGAPTQVFSGALAGTTTTVAQRGTAAASAMATAVGLATMGEHRPLGKRKRSHVTCAWDSSEKCMEGQRRWRATERGYNSILASRARRAAGTERSYATRSNTDSANLVGSVHKVARSRQRKGCRGGRSLLNLSRATSVLCSAAAVGSNLGQPCRRARWSASSA